MSNTVGSIDPSTVPGGGGGYELHQKIRTKTVRLVKKGKFAEAIDTLYDGSTKLLGMNEQGSGCDLAVYLLDVYNQSKTSVDDSSRGMCPADLDRITTILDKTSAEFWRKKVIQAAVKWSSSSLQNALGDAKLRLFIAELLVKGKPYTDPDREYFAAEAHFIAACAQEEAGIKPFAAMLNQWNSEYSSAMAKNDSNAPPAESVRRVLSGTFALRGWIPLLIARAPKAALAFLHSYIEGATKDNEALLLPVKPNPKEYKSPANGISTFSTTIYATANPTLNFSQNAVALACDVDHRAGPPSDEIKGAWNHLVRQYMQENAGGVEPFLYEVRVSHSCSSCRKSRRSISGWHRPVAT